ncbi:MAG: cold-shock protein, partial [Planctomycetia bacterium]
PGGAIVVNREHHLDHAHEDVYVALRDSFAAARRRLEDHVRRMRGGGKVHASRAEGRSPQLFGPLGYGFIESADGREIYFHRHSVSDHDFRLMEIGSAVFYGEEEGDEGPQAAFVQLVHPHRRSAGLPQGPAESEGMP